MSIQPDLVSTLLFVVLLFTIVISFFWVVYKLDKATGGNRTTKTILVVFLWLVADTVAVASGYIRENPMPGLILFFAFNNLVGIAIAFSPLGKDLCDHLSLSTLVRFQSFRLPLEIILHSWAMQGAIPTTMTWTGQNYDVVTGIVCLLASFTADRYPATARFANIIGFGFLLNVGRVAVMSSPLPFAWNVDPPLQLGMQLPYAFILPICVSAALAGHLILTRKIWLMNQAKVN